LFVQVGCWIRPGLLRPNPGSTPSSAPPPGPHSLARIHLSMDANCGSHRSARANALSSRASR